MEPQPPLVHNDITTRELAIRLARIIGVPAAMIVLYAVLPLQGERWLLGAGIGLVAIAATVPLTAQRVRAVNSSTQPALEAIEALALLLSMLVLGFSAVYVTIDRGQGQFVGLDTRVDALYFAVTTLSTVGFGDINASGQAARIAVTIQIVLDFTVLAFAVKLLTTTARRRMAARA